jgi:hypothetical protein
MTEHDADLDELLGRTRCARCGQVLDGEIECPFCSLFPDRTRVRRTPKWVFLTACFLTSPLSLPFVLATAGGSPAWRRWSWGPGCSVAGRVLLI